MLSEKKKKIGAQEAHVTPAKSEKNENGRMVLHMPHPYVNIRIASKMYEYVSFNTFEWFKMRYNVSQ